jgi:colanic acid/amylovoran biosynthesis glycosyltransferase
MELPVITSDIRGIRELVDDGLNGLLVPDKKPVAIADAIERLSRDKALSAIMGRAARKKILSDFNIRREAQKIQTIFQQAVAASSEDRAWVRGNV